MSNSEPSAIVLHGILCMCGLYKFRFEWSERVRRVRRVRRGAKGAKGCEGCKGQFGLSLSKCGSRQLSLRACLFFLAAREIDEVVIHGELARA